MSFAEYWKNRFVIVKFWDKKSEEERHFTTWFHAWGEAVERAELRLEKSTVIEVIDTMRAALEYTATFCEHDEDGPGELCDCSTAMSVRSRKALARVAALLAPGNPKAQP